ncbi:MAG: hypothetical protein OEU52_16565 [Xanthomonadales bacterium]|nr:hypothetical protein [Xanthomonadales bacterium]
MTFAHFTIVHDVVAARQFGRRHGGLFLKRTKEQRQTAQGLELRCEQSLRMQVENVHTIISITDCNKDVVWNPLTIRKERNTMNNFISGLIAASLSAGVVTSTFADSFVNDFDAVGEYDCEDEEASPTTVRWAEVYCLSGWCSVLVELCEGPLDPDAKYRIHFDTEEPYFWQDDNNQYCMTTSDQTTMYRPGHENKPYTGPEAFYENIGEDFISLAFYWDELGVEAGDYVAIWVDVHNKGIQDRAPKTDEYDGCAKPQYPSGGLGFGLGGEAMILCAGGDCSDSPPE